MMGDGDGSKSKSEADAAAQRRQRIPTTQKKVAPRAHLRELDGKRSSFLPHHFHQVIAEHIIVPLSLLPAWTAQPRRREADRGLRAGLERE